MISALCSGILPKTATITGPPASSGILNSAHSIRRQARRSERRIPATELPVRRPSTTRIHLRPAQTAGRAEEALRLPHLLILHMKAAVRYSFPDVSPHGTVRPRLSAANSLPEKHTLSALTLCTTAAEAQILSL